MVTQSLDIGTEKVGELGLPRAVDARKCKEEQRSKGNLGDLQE